MLVLLAQYLLRYLSTSDLDGQVGGRVGIGTTQPDNSWCRLQVGTGGYFFQCY